MKKQNKQPFKIVDDFFESPDLWRYHALKQDFVSAGRTGQQSASLDVINPNLFHSVAGKIIKHVTGKNTFSYLRINYDLVDESFNLGWCYVGEPQYNVAGVIFLNPNPAPNSGVLLYNKIADTDQDYAKIAADELAADPADRINYKKYKVDQRKLFRKTLTVENVYNRCFIFSPDTWHSFDSFFGTDKDSSRLAITFYGIAE